MLKICGFAAKFNIEQGTARSTLSQLILLAFFFVLFAFVVLASDLPTTAAMGREHYVLVDALRSIGARVDYLGQAVYPPLQIHPGHIDPGRGVGSAGGSRLRPAHPGRALGVGLRRS